MDLNGLLSGEIYFTYIIHWAGKIFISNKQQLYEGKVHNIRQSPIFLANHHSSKIPHSGQVYQVCLVAALYISLNVPYVANDLTHQSLDVLTF